MGLDLQCIYATEKVILNKISWKLNLKTAAEIKHSLLSLEENMEDDIEVFINDSINFSIHEYEIYAKYDQLTITFAAIKLCYNEFVKNFNIFEQIAMELNIDMDEVENCRQEMFNSMIREESNVEKSDEIESHNGSFNSDEVVFYNYDVINNNFNNENSFDDGNANVSTLDSPIQEEINFSTSSSYIGSEKENINIANLNPDSFNLIGRKRAGKCIHIHKKKRRNNCMDKHILYDSKCVDNENQYL
jgi:hypothetical protein